MSFTASDLIPLTQVRITLPDLIEQAEAGAEKIIAQNGEGNFAITYAQRLDYNHQLEREHIHLSLIDDASKGLTDIATGKTKDARTTFIALQICQAAKAPS